MWDNNSRSRTELRSWIKRSLGHGVIDVELTDDQLDDAIRSAEEYWMQWIGATKQVLVTKSSSQAIPESDIGDDVDDVVDVYFEASGDAIGNMYAWADVEYNPMQPAYGTGVSLGEIVQYQQYRKDYQRILSSDKDWHWSRETRELTLSPTSVPSGAVVVVVYRSRNMDYTYMKNYEWNLFREYAQAKAMRRLATIRMKFSDKPSAGGGFSMDGDAMWANAEAMELQIEEKMKEIQGPIGFFVG